MRTGDHFQFSALEVSPDDGPDEGCVAHVAANQSHRRHIGIHANDFGLDTLLFEEISCLSNTDGEIREIIVGHPDSHAVDTAGLTGNCTGCQHGGKQP